MAGMFITFEGGEGSGKTTVIKKLEEQLTKRGYKVTLTREPGGVDIAEQIRNVILDVNNKNMCYETETLLYAASRMQHLHEKVIPALNRGEIVICDRYLDSSLVYQGYARGIGFENVLNANCFALNHLPKLTIFIDVKPEVGLKRLEGRGQKIDRLDLESLAFHNKVYEGYQLLLKKYPDRIKRVDGQKTENEVFDDVMKLVLNELN